jgi:hypothetical protein
MRIVSETYVGAGVEPVNLAGSEVMPLPNPPRRSMSHASLTALVESNESKPRISRSASLRNVRPDPAINAPLLHELIGSESVGKLDAQFGSLQPVRTKNGEGIHPWERDAEGRPLVHPRRVAVPDAQGAFPNLSDVHFKSAIDINALKRNEKRYIWAVGAMGRVFVGEELPAPPDPVTGKERNQGHPMLVAGGNARICGEIHYNEPSDKLTLINKSGRYSRYEDRTEQHLNEVAKLIGRSVASLGLEVETEFMSGKAPEPLILPNLNLNRQNVN